MKILLFILSFLLLYACHTLPIDDEQENMEGTTISIHIDSPITRALPNDTLTMSWEKKINTATIYVFNPSGKTIYVYPLSSSQITTINNLGTLSVSLVIPGNLSSCDVYMVANTTPSASITTKTSLLSSIETDINTYNGTYAQVSAAAQRTNGFVMTGSQDGIVLTSATTANISLRRIVAKVSIQITFSSLITLGTMSMNNATLTLSAPNSNLFPLTTPNTGGTAVSFSQIPQKDNSIASPTTYRAMFYIYENGNRTPVNSYVTFTFSGTNTVLVVTTPFGYQFTLTGDGSGKISRNRVYFINATVNKLVNILVRSDNNPDITVKEEVW